MQQCSWLLDGRKPQGLFSGPTTETTVGAVYSVPLILRCGWSLHIFITCCSHYHLNINICHSSKGTKLSAVCHVVTNTCAFPTVQLDQFKNKMSAVKEACCL